MPCHIRLGFAGAPVAEAMASVFRADLLRGGHGHGHHGFRARLRAGLPEGPCGLALTLVGQGRTVPMGVVVPELKRMRACRVERLLRPASAWTVPDVLARPGCLALERRRRAMGTPAFVDGLFRFALSRWPSAAELQTHGRDLDQGRLGAEALLAELLTSRERGDMGPGLPSPLDPEFPFPLD